MLIYDCEIEKAIQGKGESRIEGIEYCEGWRDFKGMGISVIGAYDYKEDRYRLFCKDNFTEFQGLLLERHLLVGFNNIRFDNPLIRANGFTVPENREGLDHYDILLEAKAACCTDRFAKGFKLADLCSLNFGSAKSGQGGHAPVQWQRGNIGDVIDYCLNDVRLTKQLFDAVLRQEELKSPKGGNMKLRFPWNNLLK